ncbi:flagellar hook protein FlgE [Azospirillum fermentarium]|uniref:hypothetical protein n=1 Tax=Azospirillum fermentarium TaxID=1233114 RepID=UPI002226655B|nr:hypothetical protein [Azospirillum fermentarium]MCW2244601.1 flagellar hook protein FlgE [Azospirillum fermentarium]
MEIGSSTPSPGTLSSVGSAAVSGLQRAEARVADGTEQLAAGNLDPAVILDISTAQTGFAANAAVLKSTDDMSKRLLDMLA